MSGTFFNDQNWYIFTRPLTSNLKPEFFVPNPVPPGFSPTPHGVTISLCGLL